MKEGAILILSGPSGAGKSTLINKIIDELGSVYFSISTTTRAPRDGEIDGVHYYFSDVESFKKDIEDGQFLEYAMVHSNYYGTSIKPVLEALCEGKLVIFDIDVQGFDNVIKKFRDISTSIFITTPTLEVLKDRLHSRATDKSDVIEKRLSMAVSEIKRASDYDYLIVNDDIDRASSELLTIAKAARLKVSNKNIGDFISNWL